MPELNDFLKELLKERPELTDFYESEQYQLSEQIIDYMMNNFTNEYFLSKQLQYSLNYVVRLTSGDNSIPVEEYHKFISKMKAL